MKINLSLKQILVYLMLFISFNLELYQGVFVSVGQITNVFTDPGFLRTTLALLFYLLAVIYSGKNINDGYLPLKWWIVILTSNFFVSGFLGVREYVVYKISNPMKYMIVGDILVIVTLFFFFTIKKWKKEFIKQREESRKRMIARRSNPFWHMTEDSGGILP